jgi:hypothetical protein
MRWTLAWLVALHALIHLMGCAKAWGYAALPQLTQSISREMGLVWLLAAALLGSSAVILVTRPQYVWMVGAVALVTSQVAIVSAWGDARFGTCTSLRFSMPLSDYHDFGPARLARHGEARWRLPEGEFTYGEFDLQDVTYNVRR